MIINHNIAALNTHRQLGSANRAQSNSMEKLSSGLRINKAGDDAAGLAISEKMRAQVRGLDMAAKNAQDGVSLIQTAEGALNESHAILQRMRELAVQSANDTNTTTDRVELQKEVDQLSIELTRIGDTTEFNTKTLLDGTLNEATFHIGANKGQQLVISINDMRADELSVSREFTAGEDTLVDEDDAVIAKWIDKSEALTDLDGDALASGATADVAGYYDGDGVLVLAAEAAYDEDEVVVVGIDISSQATADSAITTINDAIETVSAERSKLGATQNRLEHTINNLGTSSENLTAAESRIRDVDMAKEIMELSKNAILSQAAQAMLAQANQQPQAVLQLLQ